MSDQTQQVGPTEEELVELKKIKTRDGLELLIKEGMQVHDTLKSDGFAVIRRQIDEKINDGKLKWLSPNLSDKEAETIRQKTAVWRDVYSLFQTAVRKAVFARQMLAKLDAGETLD
jgi:hypothetical protein